MAKHPIWSETARADVRALDRSGEGSVKTLHGKENEFRLHVGQFRVRFSEEPTSTIHIHRVKTARMLTAIKKPL